MKVERFALDGLLLLTPPRLFPDPRGFFVETYREEDWSAEGLPRFVQDNHSRSAERVLRGVHLSRGGAGQGKLVRCARGRIWDVAVDLRRSSPTFGQWQGFELSDENHRQAYIPPGFGHGFCVRSALADVAYKLTAYYDPATEIGVHWSDPTLAIRWPVADPIVSERDRSSPTLAAILEQLPA